MNQSDWINLFVALGTWAAVIVALLVSLGWITSRAHLEVYLRGEPPDATQIRSTTPDGRAQFWSYYWRLRVHNWGPGEAKGVEVQMITLRRKGKTGMERDRVFLPLDLQWSFGEEQRPRILRGIFRYCDLVHLDDWTAMRTQPQIVFHNVGYPSIPNELKLGERPTVKMPGEYELDVAIAARNARTIRRTISIKFDDKWWDNEADMFTKGTQIEVIRAKRHWYERRRKDPLDS